MNVDDGIVVDCRIIIYDAKYKEQRFLIFSSLRSIYCNRFSFWAIVFAHFGSPFGLIACVHSTSSRSISLSVAVRVQKLPALKITVAHNRNIGVLQRRRMNERTNAEMQWIGERRSFVADIDDVGCIMT